MRTIAAVALLLLAPLTALAQPKAGGKIVYAARQDIDTLDPHITNRAATRKLLIQFTDTLTVINPKDGKVYIAKKGNGTPRSSESPASPAAPA